MTSLAHPACTATRGLPQRSTGVRFGSPRLAAVAYTLAWVTGLSVFSSSTDVRSSGAIVLAGIRGHEAAATMQYLLTEGVTSLLLVVVVVPTWRRCTRLVPRIVAGAGIGGAAAVGLVECVLGIAIVAGAPDASTAGSVNAAVNRLDGAKMLLLAFAVAALAFGLSWGTNRRSRLVRAFAVITAVTLLASGSGYLALDNGLAGAAWISLPLLIVSVLVAGFARADHAVTPAGSR